jgi:hypothetical protein
MADSLDDLVEDGFCLDPFGRMTTGFTDDVLLMAEKRRLSSLHFGYIWSLGIVAHALREGCTPEEFKGRMQRLLEYYYERYHERKRENK